MLRSSRAATFGSAILFQAPSRRERLARRKIAVVSAVVGLAILSSLLGALSHPRDTTGAVTPAGPASYFPS